MRQERIKIDLLIHDLKVPLAVIEAGVLSLLRRTEKYGPLTDKQEKVLNRVLRNTKVTQTLVGDALELSRSRHGVMNISTFKVSYLIEQALIEIFDLADGTISDKMNACADLGELTAVLQENGVRLLVDEWLWCQEVCLDEAKTRQILRNLLNNALKYRRNVVELGVSNESGHLVFSVKDDGEGIPSVYHKKIFDSYFQLEISDPCTVRGHGLGLAGVLSLVEDMGGKLILESAEGAGAKFSVKLPLSERVPSADEPLSSMEP